MNEIEFVSMVTNWFQIVYRMIPNELIVKLNERQSARYEITIKVLSIIFQNGGLV